MVSMYLIFSISEKYWQGSKLSYLYALFGSNTYSTLDTYIEPVDLLLGKNYLHLLSMKQNKFDQHHLDDMSVSYSVLYKVIMAKLLFSFVKCECNFIETT